MKKLLLRTLFFVFFLLALVVPKDARAYCSGGWWYGYPKTPEFCTNDYTGKVCPRDTPYCTCTGGICDTSYTKAAENCGDYTDAACSTVPPAWECNNGVTCSSTAAPPPPTLGWSCTDPANGTCQEVLGGYYGTFGACDAVCGPQTWSCTDPENKTCLPDGGQYASEGDCMTVCKTETPPCGGTLTCGGSDPYCCQYPDGGFYCSSVQCGGPHGCDPAAALCTGSGGWGWGTANVPGSGITGCSTTLKISSPEDGKITIQSVYANGDPCPRDDWSANPIEGGIQYPGLIIWEYSNLATPYTPGGQTWPGYPNVNSVTLIPNGQSEVTFSATTNQSHNFMVTPGCTTGYRNILDSQERWDALKVCSRTVEYCAPSCTASCGQSDGCGGYCTNNDGGIPSLVTLTQPAANPVVLPSGDTTFTVSWTNTDTKTDSYDFVVFNPSVYLGDPVVAAQNAWAAGNNANVYSGTTSPIDSTSFVYDFTTLNLSPVVIAVRPVNSDCSPQNGGWTTITRDITSSITGNFYIDSPSSPATYSSPTCSGDTSTPITLESGSGVAAYNIQNGAAGVSGTITTSSYSISGLKTGNNHTVTLTLGASDASNFVCACPAPGAAANECSLPDIIPPSGNVNFFLALSLGPWFQARSGLIHSQGGITNNLPYFGAGQPTADCVAAGSGCSPFLITRAIGGADTSSSGIPTASGSFGMGTDGAGYETELSLGTGTAPFAAGHSNAAVTQSGYAQLSSRYDLATENITASSITDLPTDGVAQDGTTVNFADLDGTGTLTIDATSGWTISGGSKIVIFVNGNVIFDTPTTGAGPFITVDEGSFFAVVASGDITFSDNIGYDAASTPYDTTANFEGIYVADGTLTIDAFLDADIQDLKFVGAGSFVGLSGVSLPRDFADEANALSGTVNNSVPTETFIFRPDLVLNTPELMKKSTFTWQEINQITP